MTAAALAVVALLAAAFLPPRQAPRLARRRRGGGNPPDAGLALDRSRLQGRDLPWAATRPRRDARGEPLDRARAGSRRDATPGARRPTAGEVGQPPAKAARRGMVRDRGRQPKSGSGADNEPPRKDVGGDPLCEIPPEVNHSLNALRPVAPDPTKTESKREERDTGNSDEPEIRPCKRERTRLHRLSSGRRRRRNG